MTTKGKLKLQHALRDPKNWGLSWSENEKSAKPSDLFAKSPKFVRESGKDPHMGLLLSSHAGSVIRSEFDFGFKSRSNQVG